MAAQRFLLLSDVSEILNISPSQTLALVRCGDLPAVKIGGRGQWRVEKTELETFIQRMYRQTREQIAAARTDDEQADDERAGDAVPAEL